MADHSPTGPVETGAKMDYAEHEKTYHGFLTLAKYGSLFCVALLAAMAFGFFAGAGFFSGTILFVVDPRRSASFRAALACLDTSFDRVLPKRGRRAQRFQPKGIMRWDRRSSFPGKSIANEPRVAASPETVKRLVGAGFRGRGRGRRRARPRALPTTDFAKAGAAIGKAADAGKADVVLKVRRPTDAELEGYKSGAAVIATWIPMATTRPSQAMARAGVTAFAMEFMPRITRAQSMDVLSSQANLAGYQAVIDAAAEYDRALPMMMTAAGTVPAAKVFVMGVGVAGLQAIATARRLGAVVTATDVRPAAKEQVASLGAKFLAVEDEEFKAAETAGGYAKEMSKEYQAKQAALAAEHIAKQDIVITTALIPGRPAPKLVSAAMVASMKPGSVIVDLAVERGGNVEGAVPGKVVDHGQRRQDRRPSQRAGPRRRVGLAALRQEPLCLPRDAGRQDDQDACHQPRGRTGQGDDADRWRPGRASDFRQGANAGGNAPPIGRAAASAAPAADAAAAGASEGAEPRSLTRANDRRASSASPKGEA